jgi:hypothetical protein
MRSATSPRLGAVAAIALLLTACSSAPINVAPLPPAKYQTLGKAEGVGCGFLGVGPTAYNFAPMALNGRVQSAYDAALASVPGATSLINVSISDDWVWMVFATRKCTTVRGDAIKEGA